MASNMYKQQTNVKERKKERKKERNEKKKIHHSNNSLKSFKL